MGSGLLCRWHLLLKVKNVFLGEGLQNFSKGENKGQDYNFDVDGLLKIYNILFLEN